MVQITPEEVMEKRRKASPAAAPYKRRAKSTAGQDARYIVYRIFDAAGGLLYVGMTKRGPVRMAVHYKKPWAPEIRELTIEDHPSKAAAAAAETAAIKAERPKYNVAQAGREP